MALSLTAHSIAQLQAFNPSLQHGANQIFAVGSTLYYVMLSQVGTGTPSNDLVVYKSDDKVTWTVADTYIPTSAPLATGNSQDCPACLVGDQIYIIGVQIDTTGSAVLRLVIHIFDTVSETFQADSSIGPSQGGAGQQLWSISGWNSGNVLVSFTTTAPLFRVVNYNPGTDIWGTPTTIRADASKPVQQIHDPSSDLAFVFFQKTTTAEMRCATVDEALSFSDDFVVTLSNTSFIARIGLPIISSGEVIVPYRDFPSGPPELWEARATVSATPTFATQVIDDGSTLPSGQFIQNFDQVANAAWEMIDVGGTLYVLYPVDNGESPQDADSVAWIYYSEWNGSVWSAGSILYTANTPSEITGIYSSSVPGFDPCVLVSVIDPSLWDDISSLTNFILFGGTVLHNTFE